MSEQSGRIEVAESRRRCTDGAPGHFGAVGTCTRHRNWVGARPLGGSLLMASSGPEALFWLIAVVHLAESCTPPVESSSGGPPVSARDHYLQIPACASKMIKILTGGRKRKDAPDSKSHSGFRMTGPRERETLTLQVREVSGAERSIAKAAAGSTCRPRCKQRLQRSGKCPSGIV
jgi:hypothetical protein